jgi:hypothetical protein
VRNPAAAQECRCLLQGSVARPRAPLLDIARSRKREHTASWRSGYAEDCKSLHPGSIPGEASNLPNRSAAMPVA